MEDRASKFVQMEMVKMHRNGFIFTVLITAGAYAGISTLLNAIRATASLWIVWPLIVIQLILYMFIFGMSWGSFKKIGFGKSWIFLFIALGILGRVENWEIFIIPLTILITIIAFHLNVKKLRINTQKNEVA